MLLNPNSIATGEMRGLRKESAAAVRSVDAAEQNLCAPVVPLQCKIWLNAGLILHEES